LATIQLCFVTAPYLQYSEFRISMGSSRMVHSFRRFERKSRPKLGNVSPWRWRHYLGDFGNHSPSD